MSYVKYPITQRQIGAQRDNQSTLISGLEPGEQTVTPGLINQAGVIFEMSIPQIIEPDLINQAGVTFSPQVNLNVHPSLINQAGVTFSPQVNLEISVGLINQAGVTFSPQVNLNVHPDLINQAGVTFSPQVNLTVSPGLINQAGVTFSPEVTQVADTVSPGLINQAGVVFTPIFPQFITPALINQAGVTFSPTVNAGASDQEVTPDDFINQSGVVFQVHQVNVQDQVGPLFINQAGTPLDINVIQGRAYISWVEFQTPQVDLTVTIPTIANLGAVLTPAVTPLVDVALISVTIQVFDFGMIRDITPDRIAQTPVVYACAVARPEVPVVSGLSRPASVLSGRGSVQRTSRRPTVRRR